MGRMIVGGIGGGVVGVLLGGACGIYGVPAYFEIAHIYIGDGIGLGLTMMWVSLVGAPAGFLLGGFLGMLAARASHR